MDEVIVVDSSYLFSLAAIVDSNHKKAIKISRSLLKSYSTIVLPSEILFETINALWKKIGNDQAEKTADDILESNYYLFPGTTQEIRQTALEKFKKQPRSVSFTDCLVMAFADHFKTKTILGFDESFFKSGYSLP